MTRRDHLEDPAELERFAQTLELIPPETRSLLDAGCGAGAFLRLLARRRADLRVVGLELRPGLARGAAGQGRAPCVIGEAGRLPFRDGSFDCAAALEILEHLPDAALAAAAGELSRVAARHLLVSTPYKEDLIRLSCSACGVRFNPNGHLHRVDEGFLRALFPGWRLRVRRLVWSEKIPFFYAGLHDLYSRKLRPRFAPALCPRCRPDGPEGGSPPPPSRFGGRLRRILPGRMKHRWIICLFSR